MGPDSDEMAVVDPMLRVCSDSKELPLFWTFEEKGF